MVVDFHTHNFPDSIAKRAIDGMLEKLNGSLAPVGDGTLSRQIADMKRDGIDLAVMCPVATKPSQFDVILKRAVAIRSGEFGEDVARMIEPLGALHPSDASLIRHIDALLAAGIKGIKMHPYYQRFALQDPALVPFFESVRDSGLFIVCHCGLDPGYLADAIECGPSQIAQMLARVPGLGPRFVAAHLGGFSGSPPRAVDMLLDQGCWLDTAVLASDSNLPEPIRIISEWPADRLLFATDYYWTSQRFVMDWVKAHRPDPADRERIFHLNAEALLGIESGNVQRGHRKRRPIQGRV